jgi:hypothetical protein
LSLAKRLFFVATEHDTAKNSSVIEATISADRINSTLCDITTTATTATGINITKRVERIDSLRHAKG